MFGKPRSFKLFCLITIYSLIGSAIYMFYYSAYQTESRINIAINKIDHEIVSINKRLESIPATDHCDSAYIQMLNNELYDSVNIRALGVVKADSEKVCTSNGAVNAKVDKSNWSEIDNSQVFLTVKLGYRYPDNKSFAIVMKKGDYYFLASVNPMVIDRMWIDDTFDAALTEFYIDGIATPLIKNEYIANIELYSFTDLFTVRVSSPVNPYTINVVMSPASLLVKAIKVMFIILIFCLLLSWIMDSIRRSLAESEPELTN